MKCKYGKVYLIGAGPGDPELLTLKAVRTLQRADVVLVDDLVDAGVLDFVRPDARVVAVGKRGGCKSTPQTFIERLTIAEAHAGRTVARLKGGDPFIFGRGGEECQVLRTAGIEVEVINGITAGLAAPTSLGIPLTHRDLCHGAILVTGHTGDEAASAPDWRALVAVGMPLVIYMGMTRAAAIRANLLAAGMRHDMPVAVIKNATRVDQVARLTTLARLSHDLRRFNLTSPAIIVVGETVRLAHICAHSTDIAPASVADGSPALKAVRSSPAAPRIHSRQ